MAYDEPRFESGFRQEPDFRSDNGLPATYQPGGYVGDDAATVVTPAARDPQGVPPVDVAVDEDDGPDRFLVHFVWELVLLVGIGILGYLLLTQHREQVRGDDLRDLLVYGGALTLLAVSIGLSLRAGAPNLAVGSLAVAAGIFFATNGDQGLARTTAMTLGMSLAVGAVIGLLVVGLHVPGWAASLGVAFGLIAWIQQNHGEVALLARHDVGRDAPYIAGAAATLAVVGALLGAARPIRGAVGRFRPGADPAWRRGFGAASVALITLAVSGLFAGAAGVLLALRDDAVQPGDGVSLTGLALGAALLGGTSAFGRRGGVFGTLLAVTLLTLALRYGAAVHPGFPPYVVAAGAVVIGVAVTRMIEAFGAPAYEDDGEPGVDGDGLIGGDGSTGGDGGPGRPWPGSARSEQLGWTSPLPVRTSDDVWGRNGTPPTPWTAP